ncbi:MULTISPECIES: 3-hydroxyisobutyrate dehydrogenase [unclassified Azospirillum]|uniref:3-hydroxyisobutyrate dehydrogenase n=1 Tax=unclassified Azospirillum TaxID=2630922 RepID=UPI000B749359|nr:MULTISPECIES: 3-hydroxyisobutyrate dehydrogenase [unclassified Azospirillum]SNS14989.1 3-hydroxyisobutyrate dehydrogenase [Azospirillum sp. RU38E]SNS32250.1 3-hydroxyisobutyrate dehydrogenase [Azospirillum sp. RU37A]
MATIAFIGLGNMGLPMANNLLKGGHRVIGVDLAPANLAAAAEAGIETGPVAGEAASQADVVVTMLPAGPHVRAVYGNAGGVIDSAKPGTLFIDSSTVDVDSARAVASQAEKAGHLMLDAPVSGGTGGAAAGTLTFMVGGSDAAFDKAKPYLELMGKTIVHAGGPGTGQAAKICNNMVLGISMIAVSEAFALADKLGLDRQKLFDISSKSSGQCWSLTSYCPVPGPVPTSPANRDYQPGFAVDMMLKDLKLAQQAAASAGASTPLGAQAAALYQLFSAAGHGGLDFSAIVKMLQGK